MASSPATFGEVFDSFSQLQKVTWHDQLLPVSILATLHAIRGALLTRYMLAREPKTTAKITHIPWLQALILNLVLSLGSGAITALLFGHHILWLTSNQTLPLYCAIHLLIMYSPMDFAFKSIHTFWYLINPILVVADGFARGFGLTSAVDYLRFSAHSDLQTSYVALVLGGTFASCGGGLIADFFGLSRIEWGVHTPSFVQNVPYGVKVSFFLALGYVISISPELPIHRQLISLISQLSPYLLPGLELDSEESTVDISLIHFVFRSLFVMFLLFDEFGNAPLIAFEAPGSDVPDQEQDREISDLSILPKEELASEHNFLSPRFSHLNSATRPSSAPPSKGSVTTPQKPSRDTVYSETPEHHAPSKSSRLARD